MKSENLGLNFAAQSKILEGLNQQQKEAVTHKNGPLLIIAGAGTGKTSVITRRIAYIIEQKWAKPSEILALTFTEKAAAEMEERVDKLVPYGYTDMWISTFHAFGDRFLRDHSLDFGLPSNFKVLTATEQAIFMRQHIFAFDLDYFRPKSTPTSHIKALLNHFSRLKDELISPEQYLAWTESQKGDIEDLELDKYLELAKAYQRYQELMLQSGSLDYGDQIYLTHKVLSENKKILAETQKRFKYVLVDEFQDTNYAQNELVKLISGSNGNITVVGDDDQSIYRFRGASISNILKFKEDYKLTKQIVLNQNYRSTQEILDASYKLIQHNNPDRLEIKNKINKRLISDKKGNKPLLLHCSSLSSEADIVAQTIIKLKEEHAYQNKDFAILVRANNQASAFIQSLNLYNIPYIFSGSGGLLQKPEIKMAVSFLRCLANPDDNLSFFHLANSEAYGLNPNSLAKYFAKAGHRNRSISEIREEGEYDSEILPIVEDLEKYRMLIPTHKAGEILYQFLSDHKLLKSWIDSKNVADEIKIFNMATFFERIANFDHVSEDKSVLAFLSALELIIEAGDEQSVNEIDSDIDAVNILTAHAAKGLEYKTVFVVNMVSDRFPSRNIKDAIPIPKELIKEQISEGDFHIQEERRLFYVAITRAKEHLFITSGDDYGGKRIKKISPFVLEMFDEPNPAKIKHKLSPEQKIERFKKVSESQQIALLATKPIKLLRLSRQQIDDYYSCPQKYYLAHIIKIPLLENHYLVYGTAIHAALNLYFSQKMRGVKISPEQVIKAYKDAFIGSGFISREHEDQRYKQGVETLTNFINQAQKDPSIPFAVESSFEFSCGEVKVNGRYDLVFKTNDSYEICDFKTSEIKNQKDANSRIKKSTQMQMYALSWYKNNGIIPKTTLFFIEPSLKAEYQFKPDDIHQTEEMILEVSEGIKKGKFIAKPNSRECGYCAYKDICPESLA